MNTLIQFFCVTLTRGYTKKQAKRPICHKGHPWSSTFRKDYKSKSFKENGFILIKNKTKKSLVAKFNGPWQCPLGNLPILCNCHRLVLPKLDCQSRGLRLISTIQCLAQLFIDPESMKNTLWLLRDFTKSKKPNTISGVGVFHGKIPYSFNPHYCSVFPFYTPGKCQKA